MVCKISSKCLSLVVLLIVPACVAEVTVTVSGGASATGEALVDVPNQPPLIDSFSIGISNTQPVFNSSQSGKASVDNGVQFASASAFIQGNVNVGPGQFSTDFEVDGSTSVSGPAGDAATVGGEFENSMVIEVSSPILFNLNGDAELMGNTSNNIFVELEGPGVSFVANPVGFFEGSWLFMPGQYSLFEFGSLEGGSDPRGGGPSGSVNLELNGGFTPVVPEPGGMPILAAAVLLMLCARRSLSSSRRDAAD